MNIIIVYFNQRAEFAPQNLYAMVMDRGNRNCYNCGVLNTWQEIVGIEALKTKLEREENWNIEIKDRKII